MCLRNLDGLVVALLDASRGETECQRLLILKYRPDFCVRCGSSTKNGEKLEAGIRAVDIAINLRIEKAASFDIDAL